MDKHKHEIIKLFSLDKVEFKISSEAAHLSGLLNDCLEDFNDENIDVNVKSESLMKVIEYLEHYKTNRQTEITKPIPIEKDFKDIVEDWDYKFINNFDDDNLLQLIIASEYMRISHLHDLACAKTSCIMRKILKENGDNGPNLVAKRFDIEQNLDEEEMKKIEEEEFKSV